MTNGYETVIVERPDPHVGLITLNRPDKGNGVVPELARDLMAAIAGLESDADVRVVILTGAGAHFSAGADLFALQDYLAHELAVKQEPYNARVLFPVTLRIATCRFPVIAAVNGSATAGGLDLALACDLRVASSSAKFGETYVKVGLAPANGGAYFLPRLIGSGRAAELALTGDIISAADALEIGLVNHVVAPDELLPKARAIAAKIAANSWRAVEATKQVMRASWQLDLATALNMGYWTSAGLHYTDEFRQRVDDFVARSRSGGDGRPPGR